MMENEQNSFSEVLEDASAILRYLDTNMGTFVGAATAGQADQLPIFSSDITPKRAASSFAFISFLLLTEFEKNTFDTRKEILSSIQSELNQFKGL